MRVSWIAVALSFAAAPALAQDAHDHEAVGLSPEFVLEATETIDGTPLAYPSVGNPRIFSVLLTIEPGGRSVLHRHPVPTFVYVLEGELELRRGGKAERFKAGEGLVEPTDTPVQAFNAGAVPLNMLSVQVESTEIECAVPVE